MMRVVVMVAMMVEPLRLGGGRECEEGNGDEGGQQEPLEEVFHERLNRRYR